MNDIDILEKMLKYPTPSLSGEERKAIKNTIARIKDLESIEQIHREDNGKLREEVKELKEENKNLNISLLQLIISQIPDTTEEYKKYKKELQQLLQEER